MTTQQIEALRQSNAIDFAHAQATHEEVGRVHELAIAEDQRFNAKERTRWEGALEWLRQNHVVDLLHDDALIGDTLFEEERRAREAYCPECGGRF